MVRLLIPYVMLGHEDEDKRTIFMDIYVNITCSVLGRKCYYLENGGGRQIIFAQEFESMEQLNERLCETLSLYKCGPNG